jgi:hypothetical protein
MKNQAAVLPTGAAKAAMVDAFCASIQGTYTQRRVLLRHGLASQPRETAQVQVNALRLQVEARRRRDVAVALVAAAVAQLASAAVDVAGGDDGGGGSGDDSSSGDDPDLPPLAGGSRRPRGPEHRLVEVAP